MKKKNDGKKDLQKGSDHTSQGRPKFRTGTTTQGGSNYGQGSMHLGANANKQGSERNKGSNYANEQDLEIE
jgi:hypothetical protein